MKYCIIVAILSVLGISCINNKYPVTKTNIIRSMDISETNDTSYLSESLLGTKDTFGIITYKNMIAYEESNEEVTFNMIQDSSTGAISSNGVANRVPYKLYYVFHKDSIHGIKYDTHNLDSTKAFVVDSVLSYYFLKNNIDLVRPPKHKITNVVKKKDVIITTYAYTVKDKDWPDTIYETISNKYNDVPISFTKKPISEKGYKVIKSVDVSNAELDSTGKIIKPRYGQWFAMERILYFDKKKYIALFEDYMRRSKK